MKVPELVALKFENFTLKLTLLQTQAVALAKEREALIAEARVSENVPDGWLYNPDTHEFQAPA